MSVLNAVKLTLMVVVNVGILTYGFYHHRASQAERETLRLKSILDDAQEIDTAAKAMSDWTKLRNGIVSLQNTYDRHITKTMVFVDGVMDHITAAQKATEDFMLTSDYKYHDTASKHLDAGMIALRSHFAAN